MNKTSKKAVSDLLDIYQNNGYYYSAADDTIKGLYKDMYNRDTVKSYIQNTIGKGRSDAVVEAYTDMIGRNFQKEKYYKATGTKYSEIEKDTDFSKLPTNKKYESELRLLKSEDPKDLDAQGHLMDRIICESINVYNSQPVTRSAEVAMNKLDKEYEKYEHELDKYYSLPESKRKKLNYPKLSEQYWEIRNTELPDIVLKDIGYQSTKESREAIAPYMFVD